MYAYVIHQIFFLGDRIKEDEMKNAYRILVGKPEGKRSLGRYKHRWEIEMDFR
jgi:hypothetical protein